MVEPVPLLVMFLAATLAIAAAAAALLRVWRDWLDLKRLEMGRTRSGAATEIGELRQRIRRLESIADGED